MLLPRPQLNQPSSMESLPVEIIQKIFLELCTPRTTFPLRRDEPRLLVTRVCSRWRAIALSTPSLWATFYIQPFWHEPVLYSSILNAWISRAAPSALSFEFRFTNTYFVTSPMITKVIFPVIHRCTFLRFHLDTATTHRLLTLPPNSLRMLQSLTVLIEDDISVADPTPFATAFEPCPQLHTFALITRFGDHPRYLRIANFNVPWHQLTTLRLYSPSIPAHEYLDVLRKCTSLQECNISVPPIDSLGLQKILDLSHPPAVLPSLHTLHLEFAGLEGGNCAFLHALRLPNLREFQPAITTYPALWALSTFQSVLCDTIQELDLSEFVFPESLAATLALVPNLNILWLGNDTHKHPREMCALGTGAIAPRLTTLHFGFVKSSHFLFDILEARVAAAHADCDVTTFSDVIISHRGNMNNSPADEARLMALTGTGMRIVWLQ